MERTTPEKLFVCVHKTSPRLAQALDGFYSQGIPVPAEIQVIRVKHLQYIDDISKRGILWEGGPFSGGAGGMIIYAVDSIEEAKKIQENEPYYANGLSYDCQCFEWTVHAPLGMASPAHKERLEKTYRELGLL